MRTNNVKGVYFVVLVYDKDYTKKKRKNMADAGHHMFTKSVLNTPPLTEKNALEFLVSIVLMLTSLNQC